MFFMYRIQSKSWYFSYYHFVINSDSIIHNIHVWLFELLSLISDNSFLLLSFTDILRLFFPFSLVILNFAKDSFVCQFVRLSHIRDIFCFIMLDRYCSFSKY